MPKRKSKRQELQWEIRRLKASPAALVGLVEAPDEASAIKRAVKEYEIRPEDQKRLIAVRHQ
jgi:hypothetical protein